MRTDGFRIADAGAFFTYRSITRANGETVYFGIYSLPHWPDWKDARTCSGEVAEFDNHADAERCAAANLAHDFRRLIRAGGVTVSASAALSLYGAAP